MKIRITPVYREFFASLGANVVHHCRRARCTPRSSATWSTATAGRSAASSTSTGTRRPKYRVDPGFYDAEVAIIMNADAYKKLTPKQKTFLDKQALALEAMNGFWTPVRQGGDRAPGEGRHPGDPLRRRRHQDLRRQGLRRRLGRGDEDQPRVRQEAEDADLEVSLGLERAVSPREAGPGAPRSALRHAARGAGARRQPWRCWRWWRSSAATCFTRNVALPGLPRGIAWSNEISELLLYGMTLLAAPWLLREAGTSASTSCCAHCRSGAAYACEWIADALGFVCCLVARVLRRASAAKKSSGRRRAFDQDAGDARVVVPAPLPVCFLAAGDRVRVPACGGSKHGEVGPRDDAVSAGMRIHGMSGLGFAAWLLLGGSTVLLLPRPAGRVLVPRRSTSLGAWLWLGGEPGLVQLARNSVSSVTSFSLTPIPLFVLMGEVLFHTGLAVKVIDGIERLIAAGARAARGGRRSSPARCSRRSRARPSPPPRCSAR